MPGDRNGGLCVLSSQSPSPFFVGLSVLIFLWGSASLPFSSGWCGVDSHPEAPGWPCDLGLANQS